MKGQLSAEMLILIAVVLAVVAIVAIQLLGTAKTTAGEVQNKAGTIMKVTDDAIKASEGQYCNTPEVTCQSGLSCTDNICTK